MRLGFAHYQVRSLEAIQRFWCAVYMAYTYLELYRAENKVRFRNLGEAIDAYRQGNARRLIKFAYEAALNGQSLPRVPEPRIGCVKLAFQFPGCVSAKLKSS